MKHDTWIGKLFLIGAVGSVVALFILLFCVLFMNADKLGYFFLPTLLGMFIAMIYFYALILRRHGLMNLRLQMGDELFFHKFPKEKSREMRRLEREKKRELRRKEKASEKKYLHEL
ncbi:MAG: hypothetical protein E7467_01645 [Ruminococcaceae bacterium]|nr:hypothetical protein [Oscillospiraceae bacterium]